MLLAQRNELLVSKWASKEDKSPSTLRLQATLQLSNVSCIIIGYKDLAWLDQSQWPENVFKEIMVDAKQKIIEKLKVV